MIKQVTFSLLIRVNREFQTHENRIVKSLMFFYLTIFLFLFETKYQIILVNNAVRLII